MSIRKGFISVDNALSVAKAILRVFNYIWRVIRVACTPKAFKKKQYPLSLYIWHYPNVPPLPPDETAVAQKIWPPYVAFQPLPGFTPQFPIVLFVVPEGTDVGDQASPRAGNDLLECPAGSGLFYRVFTVEVMGDGYINKALGVLANRVNSEVGGPPPYPVPYPF